MQLVVYIEHTTVISETLKTMHINKICLKPVKDKQNKPVHLEKIMLQKRVKFSTTEWKSKKKIYLC